MRRPSLKKVASIILASTLLCMQVILPLHASADAPLDWSNPNSTGSNSPFTLSLNSVTPQLLTSVVSCTGIQEKIAGKFLVLNAKFQQTLANLQKKAVDELKKLVMTRAQRIAKEQALEAARKAALAGTAAGATAASATAVGTGVPGAAVSIMGLATDIPHASTTKTELTPEEQKKADLAAADKLKADNEVAQKMAQEKCLNGIAIRLARNQLTSMTRDTMNWVSKGFNGNPLFVRNVDDFMDNIQKEIIKRETDYFTKLAKENDQRYPYARDIAKQQIASYQASKDTYGSQASDMSNYLPKGATIDTFSRDFSQGGWGGWLAFTQTPTNNPLGSIMVATEKQNQRIQQATSNAQAMIDRNGGYVDQQTCVQWSKDVNNGYTTTSGENFCVKYATVTPGTAIRDKVNKAINLPESQLELVKTIDDALNSLFAALLSKFQNQGLSSLGTTNANLTSGLISGYDVNGNPIPGSTGFGSGSDGSFDITKDLGNTYAKPIDDGSWNAKTNTPTLAKGVGLKNHFYTVSVEGGTDIATNGDYWYKGDKVFFDGTKWRSGVPKYIIDKKGALQVQQDYVDNAKTAQALLPTVLSSVGELDYCIPGPNPSWEIGVQDSLDTYTSAIANGSVNPDITVQPNTVEDYVKENFIQKALQQYSTDVKNIYGDQGPMQTEFLANGAPNPSFLPMSQVGLSITGNLINNADTIKDAENTYKSEVIATQANMYRLTKIKDKINVIIAAAQKRRDTKRAQAGLPKVTQLCLDTEKVTYVVNGVLK